MPTSLGGCDRPASVALISSRKTFAMGSALSRMPLPLASPDIAEGRERRDRKRSGDAMAQGKKLGRQIAGRDHGRRNSDALINETRVR